MSPRSGERVGQPPRVEPATARTRKPPSGGLGRLAFGLERQSRHRQELARLVEPRDGELGVTFDRLTPAPHVEPWPSPISTETTAAPRQPTSDRTPESATKHLDVVRVEGTITGDEHESLGLGLRDQHAVERVAVVGRKSPGPLGVLQ